MGPLLQLSSTPGLASLSSVKELTWEEPEGSTEGGEAPLPLIDAILSHRTNSHCGTASAAPSGLQLG